MNAELKDLQRQIRLVRAEMIAKQIRRISCFNGGLDAETYRLNSQLFALETHLKRAALKGSNR